MAERLNFTKRVLEELPKPEAGKRFYFHDTKVNGLLMAVTSAGVKSFQVYRKVRGKPVRVTLGRFPDMTIEQARRNAQAALSTMAEGISPNLEKKAARARSVTLGEVFKDYLEVRTKGEKSLKPRTVLDYTQLMEKAFKDWEHKPLSGITRDMVASRHAKLGKRSEARANLACAS